MVDITKAIPQISDLNSLVTVMNYYGVAVSKKGDKGFLGRCPFHNDKNPSMHLFVKNNGTAGYKCFSCGETGDLLTFIQRKENLGSGGKDFIKSIEKAFSILNLDLPLLPKKVRNVEKYLEEEKKKEEELRYRQSMWAKVDSYRNVVANLGDVEKMLLCDRTKEDINSNKLTSEELLEFINYATYKANDVVDIEDKIEEKLEYLQRYISDTINGETILLISGTGSGKTYSVLNELIASKAKALIVLPNSSNVEQVEKDYHIPGAYDNKTIDEAIKADIAVATWDKASQLMKKDVDLSDRIVILDEVHQIFTETFRKDKTNVLLELCKKFRGRLDITATPSKLDFNVYSKILEYKQKNVTNYNVKVYDGHNMSTVIDILQNCKKGALLYNSISKLEVIANNIKDKKVGIVSSNNKKNSEIYKYIMRDSNMAYFDILLNTTTITAGVNIYEEDVTDIVIVGIKDIGSIKQYCARFRGLKEVNVHIFAKFDKQERYSTYSVEDRIERIVEETRKSANYLNFKIATASEEELQALKGDTKALDIEGNTLILDKDKLVYSVDEVSIRGNMYNTYYNSRSMEQFNVLAEEYFSKNEVVTIEDTEEKAKKEAKLKEELKENAKSNKLIKDVTLNALKIKRNVLVGYNEIVKGKISKSLREYLDEAGVTVDDLKAEYETYHINELMNADKRLTKQNEAFTDMVINKGYSVDYAWAMSTLSTAKVNAINKQINNIKYRILKEKGKVSKLTPENILYERVTEILRPGTLYREEHLEEIVKMLKEDDRLSSLNITVKLIKNVISQIYNKKRTSISNLTVANSFCLGISPSLVDVKLINANVIVDFISATDINSSLGIPSSDNTINQILNV